MIEDLDAEHELTDTEFLEMSLEGFVAFWITVKVLEPDGVEREYRSESTTLARQVTADFTRLTDRLIKERGFKPVRYDLHLQHVSKGTFRLPMRPVTI